MSSTSSTSGRGPVARAEVLHRACRRRALLVHHRADEVGDELLAGHEGDRPVGVLAVDLVADRLQEVGLAEADAAVDEERVPARRRRLRDHARRGVRELVGRADDELVEGVARDQVGRAAPATGAAAPMRRAASSGRRRRGPPRPRRSSSDLEVDGERPLRARLEVLEDRGEEVILEPLLVIAVRRPQADAPVVDADALDGTQPEIAVRRLDQRFDGADRLGPELKHPAPPVHSRSNAKMSSDFRRVHATSPCLSTAIGNRQLPRDERLDRQIVWVPVPSRRECRAQRVARGGGSLSNRRKCQQARSGRAFARSRKSVR